MGRPQEWNDESSGFDDFAFKFSNLLSGLPGDAEKFLEESANVGQPIMRATLTAREKVAARGVATALRARVGGKSLRCIRHHLEKNNGCESTSQTLQREKLVSWKERWTSRAGRQCKLFPVEDFMCWGSTHQGGKEKHSMSGWWCGACGRQYDSRKPIRLFTLQIRDTANEQVVFQAFCVRMLANVTTWSACW